MILRLAANAAVHTAAGVMTGVLTVLAAATVARMAKEACKTGPEVTQACRCCCPPLCAMRGCQRR